MSSIGHSDYQNLRKSFLEIEKILRVWSLLRLIHISSVQVFCGMLRYALFSSSPEHRQGIRDLPMPPLLPSGEENMDIGFPEDSDDVASPSDDSDSSVNFDRFHEAWERRKKL